MLNLKRKLVNLTKKQLNWYYWYDILTHKKITNYVELVITRTKYVWIWTSHPHTRQVDKSPTINENNSVMQLNLFRPTKDEVLFWLYMYFYFVTILISKNA